MENVIHISQPQAAAATTFKELVKLYNRKDREKFKEAIEKNEARYEAIMDEILGRK